MGDVMPYMFEGKDVRVVMIDGEPWWVLVDVCRVLGIGNPAQATSRLDDDEYMQVDSNLISNEVGGRDPYVISEPGLYSLILGSRKAVAKRLRRWITHVVLPSIRKTGGYGNAVDELADDPAMIAFRLALKTSKRVERVEITVDQQGHELRRVSETTTRLESEFAPKVRAYEELLASDDAWDLKRVADHFGLGDKGRQTLVNKLRELGILCQRGPRGGVQAYAHYYQKPTRYFVQKFYPREATPWKKDETVEVTPAGIEFLRKKLFGDFGQSIAA